VHDNHASAQLILLEDKLDGQKNQTHSAQGMDQCRPSLAEKVFSRKVAGGKDFEAAEANRRRAAAEGADSWSPAGPSAVMVSPPLVLN
jgi:hypothetical protein